METIRKVFANTRPMVYSKEKVAGSQSTMKDKNFGLQEQDEDEIYECT